MKPIEARNRIMDLLKKITDEKLRKRALRAALNYFKTTNIVEKKVCRERIITFYSEWLDKIGASNKKEQMAALRRLILVARR